ncbi:hypothetical protein ACROYT_G015393 [Oculina patagonica]
MLGSSTSKVEIYSATHGAVDGNFDINIELTKVHKPQLLTLNNQNYATLLSKYSQLKGVKIEDNDTRPQIPIHIVLGASAYATIKKSTTQRVEQPGQPVAEKTLLQWTLMSPGREDIGIPCLLYIDDRHIGEISFGRLTQVYFALSSDCEHAFARASSTIFIVCYTLSLLGYFIGLKKSILAKRQCVPYLGFSIDSVRQAFTLLTEKTLKFIALMEFILSSRTVDMKALQHFAGKCTVTPEMISKFEWSESEQMAVNYVWSFGQHNNCKGVRKSSSYQELLGSLQQETSSRDEQIERLMSPSDNKASDSPFPKTDPLVPDVQDCDPDRDWARQMRDAIEELGVPDGIDIDSIAPGQPTAMTRVALDAEYIRWLPPLVLTRPKPPVRCQRNNLSPRARRRAAHARTQQSFKKNRKRCAGDILSGLWKEESSPVPMAQQEPYWRDIFQVPSMEDKRKLRSKGPVQWSVVAPITIKDINTALRV